MFHFSYGCTAPIDVPSMGASAPTAPGKSAPMTHTQAKGQGQRSLSSKVYSGNGWTDVTALPGSLRQLVTKRRTFFETWYSDYSNVDKLMWMSVTDTDSFLGNMSVKELLNRSSFAKVMAKK